MVGFLKALYETARTAARAARARCACSRKGSWQALTGGEADRRDRDAAARDAARVDDEVHPAAPLHACSGPRTVEQVGLGFRPFTRAAECLEQFQVFAFHALDAGARAPAAAHPPRAADRQGPRLRSARATARDRRRRARRSPTRSTATCTRPRTSCWSRSARRSRSGCSEPHTSTPDAHGALHRFALLLVARRLRLRSLERRARRAPAEPAHRARARRARGEGRAPSRRRRCGRRRSRPRRSTYATGDDHAQGLHRLSDQRRGQAAGRAGRARVVGPQRLRAQARATQARRARLRRARGRHVRRRQAVASHPEDAKKFMMEVMSNLTRPWQRFEAARALLASDPRVDPSKIAAIGYCMGGAVVLHMARARRRPRRGRQLPRQPARRRRRWPRARSRARS